MLFENGSCLSDNFILLNADDDDDADGEEDGGGGGDVAITNIANDIAVTGSIDLSSTHATSDPDAVPGILTLQCGGAITLQSGIAVSCPSPTARRMTKFYLKASGTPAVAQAVNVIVWFDVAGFGS